MQRGIASIPDPPTPGGHRRPGLRARLGLLGAIAAASGCAADGGDGGIILLKNVAPAAECKVTAAESEIGVASGAIDATAGAPLGYLFYAQVKSRITAIAGQEDQRTIFTTGAKVDIAFPDSTLFTPAELDDFKAKGLTHFKSLFTAEIRPGGLSDVPFELIPRELVAAAAGKPGFTSVVALATFTIVGGLGAIGEDVVSQPYQFPVTIRNGGFARNAGACAELPTSFAPQVGNSCNPGQDGVVDCCSSPAGALVCPAVGTKA